MRLIYSIAGLLDVILCLSLHVWGCAENIWVCACALNRGRVEKRAGRCYLLFSELDGLCRHRQGDAQGVIAIVSVHFDFRAYQERVVEEAKTLVSIAQAMNPCRDNESRINCTVA